MTRHAAQPGEASGENASAGCGQIDKPISETHDIHAIAGLLSNLG
ncbi:MAG: hypothetical protein WAL34_04135 [Acidobacteriaceae bacterium]